MGIETDRSPVAHPEIVGDGIEFDWANSKLSYRAYPLKTKRNKKKFHELVDCVLGPTVLTIDVVRSNARRARQYMLAYNALDKLKHKEDEAAQSTANNTHKEQHDTKYESKIITYSLIEKAVHLFQKRRTHRNVLDFDEKYLKDQSTKFVVNEMAVGTPNQ